MNLFKFYIILLKKKIIIAIDGYSSCGKSSFAKLIASDLQYIYLDSGAMYRAIALWAIKKGYLNENGYNDPDFIKNLPENNISFKNINGENRTFLNGEDVEKEIRKVDIAYAASTISKVREVREYLVSLQQAMGTEKGIVMDGRDIGTVVFPDAEVKIFMTAETNIRVKRRFDELKEKGISASFEEVVKDIEARDKQDTEREISPLRQAVDAVVLDNSHMTFKEQMIWFRQLVKKKKLLAN